MEGEGRTMGISMETIRARVLAGAPTDGKVIRRGDLADDNRRIRHLRAIQGVSRALQQREEASQVTPTGDALHHVSFSGILGSAGCSEGDWAPHRADDDAQEQKH
jgi:hypothetical protein